MNALPMAFYRNKRPFFALITGLFLGGALFVFWLAGGQRFLTQLAGPQEPTPQAGAVKGGREGAGSDVGQIKRAGRGGKAAQRAVAEKTARSGAPKHAQKQQAVYDAALIGSAYSDGYGNRELVRENDFQITYTASSDTFNIHILDEKDPASARVRAEEHLLKNIFKTDDASVVCAIQVSVFLPGALGPSRLTLCGGTSQGIPDLQHQLTRMFVPEAQATHDWCSNYPAGANQWCDPAKGFLQPYFGNVTDKANRVAYREIAQCGDPMKVNSIGATGLFQIVQSAFCGNTNIATGLPADRAECQRQLQDPNMNAWVARHIFDDNASKFCPSKYSGAQCSPWEAGCACHVCGDQGTAGIAIPPSPMALPAPPPPPPPGDIVVTKADPQFPGFRTLNVWLTGGSPTGANSATFRGLSGGAVYEVHLSTGGATNIYYSLCDSNQPGCARTPCDPFDSNCSLRQQSSAYHACCGNWHAPERVSSAEVKVSVVVPAGGFVDLVFYHWQSSIPVTQLTDDKKLAAAVAPFISVLVPEAEAQGAQILPPPPASELAPRNLPSCSDASYGGSGSGDPKNIFTEFIAYNATQVEYEAYENGALIYNSLRDEGLWQNLSPHTAYRLYVNFWNLAPGAAYSWRVRAANGGVWSSWRYGYPWTVSYCTPPPPPPPPSIPPNPFNFLSPQNVPSCSTTAVNGVVTRFDIRSTTKVEVRLRRANDGVLIWTNENNPWTADDSWTWFEIVWNGLAPGQSYTWTVRAGNSAGWSNWIAGPNLYVPVCQTYGVIKGIKVKMPNNQQNVTPPAAEKVWVDSGTGTGSPVTTSFGFNVTSGNHVLHTTVPYSPSNWLVGRTVCTNSDACHTQLPQLMPTSVNSAGQLEANVQVYVPPSGFSSVWWHFWPPPYSRIKLYFFNDRNGNGVRDSGEQFMRNKDDLCTQGGMPIMSLYPGLSQAPFSGQGFQFVCGAEPFYDSGVVPAGTYTLYPSPPLEWKWTNSSTFSFTLPAGTTVNRYVGLKPYDHSAISDYDHDQFDNSYEWYLGTYYTDACPNTNTEPAWPADFNNDRIVSGQDLNTINGFVGKTVWQDPKNVRYDLTIDGVVDIQDLNVVSGFMGKSCLPDLTVSSSILLAPGTPVSGNVVSVGAAAQNNGYEVAGSSQTRLRIDVGNNGTWDVNPANASTGGLWYQGSEAETWTNVWTATLGTHKFEVCADATNIVAESNEANNCATRVITITLGGYWKLDENTGTFANDSSGNGNKGTLQNAPAWLTGSSCKSGSCLSFNAVNNYVSVPNASSLNPTTGITVSAWVYARSFKSGSPYISGILSKYSCSPFAPGYILRLGDAGLANNKPQFSIQIGGAGKKLNGNTVLVANTWYHLVATYNASSGGMRLYVNGTLDASNTQTGNMDIGTGALEMGRDCSDNNRIINGVIDDARIYNLALTAQEVAVLYNATK